MTTKQLEKEGKVQGVDFKIPSKASINNAFSASNQFKTSSGNNTGVIPFIKNLQSRNDHDNSHPCGHYVAALKRNWRYDSSFQQQLILDYLYDDGTEKVPVMNPVNFQLKVGVDDKTSLTIGRNVSFYFAQNQ